MDRIIKFRGKRLDCGLWVYGGLFHSELETQISDCNDICNSRIDVDIETVGQYTGVEDSEENEIYKGDYFIHGTDKGVVQFGIYSSGTFHEHIGFYVDFEDKGHRRKDLGFWAKNYRIQGNLYEGV